MEDNEGQVIFVKTSEDRLCDCKARYASVNTEGKKNPILLIHGFGASIEVM